MSYCCETLETKDVSAAGHSAGRQQSRVRSPSTYENMVASRESSSHVVAETMKTRIRGIELQEEPGKLAWEARSKRQGEILDEIDFFLIENSLAEWLSCLAEICGGDGRGVKDVHPMLALEPFQDLHLGVSRLLKICLIQF